jgi:hypothetical protein
MVQLTDEPTYITTVSANLLDIIITDSPGYVKSVNLHPPLGSKHSTLYLEFQITYPRDKPYNRQIWDYDKGNYNLLNSSISRFPWNDIILSDKSIDEKAIEVTDSFLNLCKDSIPNRVIKVKPRDLPWITQECKTLIKLRDRRYRKFRRTRAVEDEFIWKSKAREVRLAINLARLNYRQKIKDTLSNPDLAPKHYWSLV